MVEFVSYDGKFPNLCSGILVLNIDGEEVVFPKYCMFSGGGTWFDDDWCDHVSCGEWTVEVPAEYTAYYDDIHRVVNENVPFGCCGGCL